MMECVDCNPFTFASWRLQSVHNKSSGTSTSLVHGSIYASRTHYGAGDRLSEVRRRCQDAARMR